MFFGWFIIDIAASFPTEVLGYIIGNDKRFKLIGLIKLIWILRLGRMISFLKANQKLKFSLKIFQIIFFLALIIHWLNCGWYYVVVLDRKWIPPKDQNYHKSNIWLPRTPIADLYNLLTYTAVQVLLANDMYPMTNTEIIVGALLLVFGTLVMGIWVGEISNLLQLMGQREQN